MKIEMVTTTHTSTLASVSVGFTQPRKRSTRERSSVMSSETGITTSRASVPRVSGVPSWAVKCGQNDSKVGRVSGGWCFWCFFQSRLSDGVFTHTHTQGESNTKPVRPYIMHDSGIA